MYRNYEMYDNYSRHWGWGGGIGVPLLGGLILGGLAATALGGPGFFGGGYPYYGGGYPYYGGGYPFFY